MRPRVLCVGVDPGLLSTRQAILTLSGYATAIATPDNVDERLADETFDLVILSAQLGDAEKQRIRSTLRTQSKVISLERLVMPEELLDMVASRIGPRRENIERVRPVSVEQSRMEQQGYS